MLINCSWQQFYENFSYEVFVLALQKYGTSYVVINLWLEILILETIDTNVTNNEVYNQLQGCTQTQLLANHYLCNDQSTINKNSRISKFHTVIILRVGDH